MTMSMMRWQRTKSNAMRKSAKTKEEELRGIEQELREKLVEIENS